MEGVTFQVGMLAVGGVVGLSTGVIALYLRHLGTKLPKEMEKMKTSLEAQVQKIEDTSKERLGEFKAACGLMRAGCQEQCRRDLDRQAGELSAFHQEFHETILGFPEKYTLREDHVRWSIRIEALINDIHSELFKPVREVRTP